MLQLIAYYLIICNFESV